MDNNKSISVCIIAKNEEKMIGDCILSVKDIANEIIVVDTGSNDNTMNICKKLDCRIFKLKWNDDFSESRNFALSKAQSNYILSIDADERCINPEKISEILNKFNDNIGGCLVQIKSELINRSRIKETNLNKQIRLFRNDSNIRYNGIVHEQIINSIENSDMKIIDSEIEFLHLGYNISEKKIEQKRLRNLNLLNSAIEQQANNPYLLLQRAKTYFELEKYEQAEIDIKNALKYDSENSSTFCPALNVGASIALHSSDLNLAEKRVKQSLELIPNQVYAHLLLAEIHTGKKDFASAYESYKEIPNIQKTSDIKSQIIGDLYIAEEQIAFRLGRSLLNLKLFDEAEKEFARGNKINPNDTSNIVGLANIAYQKRNFDLSFELLNQAVKINPANTEIQKFLQQVKKKTENSKQNKILDTKQDINQSLLSLCMIVKNEAEYLQGCLESIKDVVDEIVIVDTGSTDNTKQIAEKFNAKIYDFPWTNSFADARNESIKHCTGKWILYLDGDERLNKSSANKIRSILKNTKSNLGALIVTIESNHLQLDDSTELHRGGYPRIIRNYGYPKIAFRGRVHEQITPSIFALGKSIDFTDLIIEHLGYNKSREEMNKKVKRNYNMLIQHVQEEPLNGYAWYQLGQTLAQLTLFKEAEDAIRMAIKTGKLSESVYASASATLSQIVGSNKNFEEALFWAEESLTKAPEQVYALHLKAYALMYLNKFKESEQVFLEVLNRLNKKKDVPRTGFDIVIPKKVILEGLNKVREKLKE